MCLNVSYLNNFPALHAEQTKTRFFAEDVFSAKIFSDASLLTKNVVFDGIWGKLISRFWWNLGKSNTSFYKEFCTKLKINELRIKKNHRAREICTSVDFKKTIFLAMIFYGFLKAKICIFL